ncbi:hypothetical protein WJX84_009411 [Apatococcus fuscideae]|uniref:protein-serine/threonine phosphatase n=1 Tax=Apatococcus fuscideae TaxID=2026836 RepID=A0AAW1SXT7_9CHLO
MVAARELEDGELEEGEITGEESEKEEEPVKPEPLPKPTPKARPNPAPKIGSKPAQKPDRAPAFKSRQERRRAAKAPPPAPAPPAPVESSPEHEPEPTVAPTYQSLGLQLNGFFRPKPGPSALPIFDQPILPPKRNLPVLPPMDPIPSRAIPMPITLPAPPPHAFGLPKDSPIAISSESPHSEQNGASRPPIGSTFYTSPDGKQQGRKKRRFGEDPASAADPRSRRIGAAAGWQGTSQTQSMAGGSSALSTAGQALIRSKAAEAEAAQAEELRLTNSIKDAAVGVQQATRNVSMPEAMKNLDGVCGSLRLALRKLYNLYKCLKQRDGIRGADDCKQLAQQSGKVHAGLRVLHILSTTGAGRTRDMSAAFEVMRIAIQDRTFVLTSHQQGELEAWVSRSKIFAELLGGPKQPKKPQQQPAKKRAAPPKSPSLQDRLKPTPGNATDHSWDANGQPTIGQVNGAVVPPQRPSAAAYASDAPAAFWDPTEGYRASEDEDMADAQPSGTEDDMDLGSEPVQSENAQPTAHAPSQSASGTWQDREQQRVEAQASWQDLGANVAEVERQAAALSRPHSAHGRPQHLPQDLSLLGDSVDVLLQKRKLCLVLDLDHTLSFELWIHTNGNRSYATAICDLLDPTKELFGQRIIAQTANAVTSDEKAQANAAKRLLEGLEGRDSITVVVDDTSSVWSDHAENLLAVERYVYFPSSRRQFGMKSKSLLEINRDECSQNGMLMVALKVLLRVHAHMFEAMRKPCQEPSGLANWDIRQILQDQRKQVLAGVRILFSRVIPLEQKPESHALWKLALAFGAVCVTQMDSGVTHVITNTVGTEKVFWAQQNGKHVVTPAWLECSCTLWRRHKEDSFRVQAGSLSR